MWNENYYQNFAKFPRLLSAKAPIQLKQAVLEFLPSFQATSVFHVCVSIAIAPAASVQHSYQISAGTQLLWILNEASKLLQLSEVILQCSTLTKEDQYPVRAPAASGRSKCHTNTLHRSCHVAFDCFTAANYIPWASETADKRVHCFLFISFHYKPGTETLDRNFSRKMLFVIKQEFQCKWQNQQNPSKNHRTIPIFSSSSLQQMTEHNS